MGKPLGQVKQKGSVSFPFVLLDSANGDRSHVARVPLVPCGSPKSSRCQVILQSASFPFLLLDSVNGDRSHVARAPLVPCGSPKSSRCQVILQSASFPFLLLDSMSGDRLNVGADRCVCPKSLKFKVYRDFSYR